MIPTILIIISTILIIISTVENYNQDNRTNHIRGNDPQNENIEVQSRINKNNC